MALKPGYILEDRYEIKEKVGAGGFGNVYLAHDKTFGDDVAVKEFNLYSAAQFSNPEEMQKRFEQEARITRKLEHPNIVSIYNLFYAQETCYIIMPFLPETLTDRLKAQKYLPVPEGVRIMEQITAGLGYAHTFQSGESATVAVVHCDIKPGNILLDKNSKAQVTDFGIAHVSEDIDASFKTVGSFEAGTVEYMAPEQLKGIRDDPRIDVYALGALFYKMLTGKNYLGLESSTTGHAQATNIMRIIKDEPSMRPLQEKNIPPPIIQIILKALAKNPAERYANAEEMHQAIVAYQQSDRVDAESAPVVAQKSTSTNFLPWIIVGVISLCLLLGLGGGILVWLNFSEPESPIADNSTPEANLPDSQPTEAATDPLPTQTPTVAPTDQPTPQPTPTVEIINTPTPEPVTPPGPITCGENMAFIPASGPVLNDFCLDVHEVTTGAYQQCQAAGTCEPPAFARSQSQTDYYGNNDFDNYPVIQITWFNAQTYCEFVNGRLPTAAEWDLAAGGPQGNSYPDIPDPKAPDAKAVQSEAQDVTAEGLYDLMGNVREWVDEDADTVTKVIKGGSFSVGDKPSLPDLTHFNVGFRCASDGILE